MTNNQGEKMTDIHVDIATDLYGLGGHLSCNICNETQGLGSIAHNLSAGWPKCCGYTMTWITDKQMEQPK